MGAQPEHAPVAVTPAADTADLTAEAPRAAGGLEHGFQVAARLAGDDVVGQPPVPSSRASREDVVAVVGNAARQCPQGLHFLRLHHLFSSRARAIRPPCAA